MLNTKINRQTVAFSNYKNSREEEKNYWSKASIKDKLEMITYLRECFYGAEATTGRLQRLYQFSKQK